jgi:hypothetical protein
MTKPDVKPDDSETTGLVPLASGLERAIGLLAGGIGSEKQRMTDLGLPAVLPVAMAQAITTDEREIDRPAEWPTVLRSCIGEARWLDSVSDRYGWDGYPVAYDVANIVPAEAVDHARQYWAAYRDMCAPLDENGLARALLGLRDMTIRKAEEGSDWQITLENWLDELRNYPADIVLWAVHFWRRNERFWPTWCEFKQLLDRRVAQRRACMDALKKIGERGGRSIEAKGASI